MADQSMFVAAGDEIHPTEWAVGRTPRVPWILLAAETCVGERGTGVAHGLLSDIDGPFGCCAQTLIFDHKG